MRIRKAVRVLRGMLREQVCCVGRIAARHHLPDDALWEIVKGFEVIYQQHLEQLNARVEAKEGISDLRRAQPHSGLMYLLDKLDSEEHQSMTIRRDGTQ